jgi:hypothetical protein
MKTRNDLFGRIAAGGGDGREAANGRKGIVTRKSDGTGKAGSVDDSGCGARIESKLPARAADAAYAREGDSGLVHGNVGKPSNRKTAREIRERAVKARLERYSDFGPAFAAEKLRDADQRGRAETTVDGRRVAEGEREAAGIPEPAGAAGMFRRTDSV